MSDFSTAKSYQIEGCDRYDTLEECFVSRLLDTDGGSPEDVARLAPITVHAYRLADRVKLDLDNLSDEMMTDFEEIYADENFGLTDDIDRLKDAQAYNACKRAIWEALQRFEESLPVTRLESNPFASRTYTPDEVIAILREVRPRWFREVG